MRVLFVLVALWVTQGIDCQQAPQELPSLPPLPPPDFFSNKSCFNGTLRGECLEIIINQICRDMDYTPNVAKQYYQQSGEFSCQGIGCYIGTLISQYCRPSRILDQRKTPPTFHSAPEQQETSLKSHSIGNNIVGACAKFVNVDTYRIVEEVAGQNCRDKLRQICFDCPPPAMPKKILLEQMLLDSYRKLQNIESPKGFVKAVRVNSTERNYPREH